MMMASLDVRYAGFGLWRNSHATWGVSDDAGLLAEILKELAEVFHQPAIAHKRFKQPIYSLIDLYNECSKANWDWEGALPVREEAISEACTILFLLPTNVPVPTFLAEPSGAVAFEWYKDRGKTLILSVRGTRSIEYAALLGEGNEAHGKANYSGSLPKVIRDQLDAFAIL